MTPIEFCYWLQGWAELEGGKKPTMEQWKAILDHLNLVFDKVTPPMRECAEEISEEETELDLDGPLCSPEKLMAQLLGEAIDRVEDAPAQVVFNRDHSPGVPLTLTDQLICSSVPDSRDMAFCHTPEELSFRDRIPRNIRND